MSTTTLSGDAVLQQVYDPPTQALKTTIQANISGAQEVIISAADDSIKSYTYDGSGNPIGSTGGALNVNTSGSSTVTGNVNASIEGLTSFKTSQLTVGTSAAQVTPSPLSNRSSLSIKVTTTSSLDAVYIGPTSGVTTSNGYALFSGDSVQLDLTPSQSIYAIGTSLGQILYILELGS